MEDTVFLGFNGDLGDFQIEIPISFVDFPACHVWLPEGTSLNSGRLGFEASEFGILASVGKLGISGLEAGWEMSGTSISGAEIDHAAVPCPPWQSALG